MANALSEQSKNAPLNADGQSVADLLASNGFTNFTTQDAAGDAGAAPSQANNTVSGNAGVSNTTGDATANVNNQGAIYNNSSTTNATADSGNADANNGDSSSNNNTNNATDAGDGDAGNTTTGADFGSCDPTMSFEGGRNGRPGKSSTSHLSPPPPTLPI